MVSPITIGDVLRENVRARPHAQAASQGSIRVTWAQLSTWAWSVVAWLHAHGVRKGDRVALILPNQLEFLCVYWACALSGIVLVPISPRLRADDLGFVLRHSGSRFAFVPEATEEFSHVNAIRTMRLGELKGIIVVPSAGLGTSDFGKANVPSGAIGFADVLRAQWKNGEIAIDKGEPFGIIYTSGTTGIPKGAVLSHGALVWNARELAACYEITEEDTLLSTWPLAHIIGVTMIVLMPALVGARTVLAPTLAAANILDLCEQERVTIHLGVPTTWVLLLGAQSRVARDLSRLRTGLIAGAPVAAEVARRIRDELHCDVHIGYGLTETAPALTHTRFADPEVKRSESVGRPLDGVEIRISHAQDGVGEVEARSPGMFSGYFENPEVTNEAFTADGWFRTGDIGWVDDEGYVHVAGRVKDIIIRAGLQAYPAEIESHIAVLPWVGAVVVFGLPDKVLGERICACIVVNPSGAVPTDLRGAVRSALAGRIADYKIPDTVVAVDEFPMTPSGKVQRFLLRERIAAQPAVVVK